MYLDVINTINNSMMWGGTYYYILYIYFCPNKSFITSMCFIYLFFNIELLIKTVEKLWNSIKNMNYYHNRHRESNVDIVGWLVTLDRCLSRIKRNMVAYRSVLYLCRILLKLTLFWQNSLTFCLVEIKWLLRKIQA